MRPIKFRVWDGEKMIYNITPWQWDFVLGKWFWECLNNLSVNESEFRLYGYKFKEIMQFTGLLDRNGKDIWEGDIVHYKYDYYGIDNWEVCFEYDRWIMKRGERITGDMNCSDDPNYNRWEESEVIGSIYQNPELLKEK